MPPDPLASSHRNGRTSLKQLAPALWIHVVCIHKASPQYLDSSISKVLTVLKWQMITTLNRKLLEKQRMQNHFASYEARIGHFFYNINATVSFGNRLALSIFRFLKFFTGLTDRQTKPIA